MALSRCPDCGRVIDGTSCFACGYEMPAPSLDALPPDEASKSQKPSPKPAPGPSPFDKPHPSSIPDAAPIDLVDEAPGLVHDSMADAGIDFGAPQVEDAADEFADFGGFGATEPNPIVAPDDFSFDDAFGDALAPPAAEPIGFGFNAEVPQDPFDAFTGEGISNDRVDVDDPFGQPSAEGSPFDEIDEDPFDDVPLGGSPLAPPRAAEPVEAEPQTSDDVDGMFDAMITPSHEEEVEAPVEPPKAKAKPFDDDLDADIAADLAELDRILSSEGPIVQEDEQSDISDPDEVSIADRLLALAFTLRSEERERDAKLVEEAAEILKGQ